MTKRRDLPPANRVPEDVPALWAIEYYRVGSWTDAPASDRTARPDAVVLEIKLANTDIPLGLRLKSPEAVDILVRALQRHRADVWPEATQP